MEGRTSLNGEIWGTLEELLLACAVIRHGTTCWDSIANELQKRINHSFVFSPHNCRQKYVDLKRRFSADGGAAEERENDDGEELLRMVDELRKLRVDQLKREVQRHDLSIVSLQLKVKRLEEERENTLQKIKEPEGGSDLRVEPDGNTARTGVKAGEPERYSPEKFDSAENRSFNESNEPSHNNKADNKNSSPEKEKESKSKQRKPEVKVGPDPVEPVKESGSVASRHAELGESVSESKRDSGKQSSDVQSSSSLSKLKKKRRRFKGGGSSGDELEAEKFSPANKRISVKSQPLIRCLEILRSHKHGSIFQRRLPSQETEKYRNMIRQHMDLDMVQSRLDKGLYNDCHPKFYRDLLLIFTNAVLFYCKSSAEHIAARELRKLVTDEITQMTQKSDNIRSDMGINHPEPALKKPRSSTTNMVVCRRRSSSCMQALSESMNNKDGDKVENEGKEEEPKVDRGNLNRRKKKREEENENEKLGVIERSSLRSGGLRLSNNNNRKIISKEVVKKREKVVTNQKPEISSRKGASVSKKQGVANFLKRIKQNSPSTPENEKHDDSEEQDGQEEEENTESREKEESGNLKRNTRKKVDVVVSRRNPTRRGEREAATARRADGRPPKRKVAVISSTPEPRKGGRSSGRDGEQKSKKKPRR